MNWAIQKILSPLCSTELCCRFKRLGLNSLCIYCFMCMHVSFYCMFLYPACYAMLSYAINAFIHFCYLTSHTVLQNSYACEYSTWEFLKMYYLGCGKPWYVYFFISPRKLWKTVLKWLHKSCINFPSRFWTVLLPSACLKKSQDFNEIFRVEDGCWIASVNVQDRGR